MTSKIYNSKPIIQGLTWKEEALELYKVANVVKAEMQINHFKENVIFLK
jgi:hypothetical protein